MEHIHTYPFLIENHYIEFVDSWALLFEYWQPNVWSYMLVGTAKSSVYWIHVWEVLKSLVNV